MKDGHKRPIMIVLAGPNGAGKSTFYEIVIKPKRPEPFVNADIIQSSELRVPDFEASYEAAKIAAKRREEFLQIGKSFITETTFSHPSKLELLDQAIESGFRVVVYHIGVGSSDLAVARVQSRVVHGGHNVPEEKIKERYERNLLLIREAVLKVDKAYIYDNSTLQMRPHLAIMFEFGRVIRVGGNIPEWVRGLYHNELRYV